MISYYSSVIILSCIALGVLCICMWENDRIKKENKWLYYLTYIMIILAAFAEWLGVQWGDNTDIPQKAIVIAKCADYILTPIAGSMFIAQTRIKNIWSKILFAVIGSNTVFQVISAFTGWMVNVDENNHYTHGRYYFVYMIVYLIVAVITVVEFIIYGSKYRKQNKRSLYAVLALTIIGIGMQEIIGNGCRTAYITLTVSSILMYIHITEYYQMAVDDHVLKQEKQIVTDSLTGILNRYAYDKTIEELSSEDALPDDLAVISIDLNGLKNVNDSHGHDAGDELICGAARCIETVFSPFGKCFRIGGDEFVVIANMTREQAEQSIEALEQKSLQWRGKKSEYLRMAVGTAFASDYTEIAIEQLTRAADLSMYDSKNAYYREPKHNRRKR